MQDDKPRATGFDAYQHWMWRRNKTFGPLTTGCGRLRGDTPLVVIALEGDGARPSHYGSGYSESGKMFTLNTIERHAVVYGIDDQQAIVTLGKPPRKYSVRRLTPLECCRLQGFPDWWEDGVQGSDTARYKMWGNGMALPNMLFVMRGVARVIGEGKPKEDEHGE